MIIDLLLTYVLNMVLYWGPALAIYGKANLCATMQSYHPEAACSAFESPIGVVAGIVGITAAMTDRIFTQAGSLSPANILNYAEGCTTMLTSIWTVLIVMAMIILRLISPRLRTSLTN